MEKKPQEQTKNRKRKAPKTAFKKGQSGNPGGRPKGSTSFRLLMERIGLEESTKDPRLTKDESIIRNIFDKAEDGDKWAQQFVVEQRDGKAPQSVSYTEKKLEPLEGIVIE